MMTNCIKPANNHQNIIVQWRCLYQKLYFVDTVLSYISSISVYIIQVTLNLLRAIHIFLWYMPGDYTKFLFYVLTEKMLPQ